MLKDSYDRNISDLRISVTDRCNYRCFYCKSMHGPGYLEHKRILSYEEIERLVAVFLKLGIQKIRITGGEPLLRKELDKLVRRISLLPGLQDLALTTNGFNFFEKAELFSQAGLNRVTLSLDSLRADRFREITRSDDLPKVLASLEAAQKWGLNPVKVNCVVVRGLNDDELFDFTEFARERDLTVRFIEFMPLDEDEDWSRDKVVTGSEILTTLRSRFDLLTESPEHPSATARNYSLGGGRGRIGLIMPVSQPFCGACSRIRLTADGKLRTCLFSLVEHDLKALLRGGADDSQLESFIVAATLKKEAGHRINQPDFVAPSRSMSYIGG